MRPILIPIERDSNGFATESAKNCIYSALPVCAVRYTPYENVGDVLSVNYINKDLWFDYVGDIERKTYYTHYFKCPEL